MSKRRELAQKRQQRARRQQLTIIGVVVVVAVLLIGWQIYVATRPIGPIVSITPEAYPFADGKALGSPQAPVLVQEFADFQCPFCGVFATTSETQLIEEYVATGKVKYEYHHYIVVDGNVGGSESRDAAEASECANEQDQFWNYHKLVFTNQSGEGEGAFSVRRLKAFAETLGLDMNQFNACLDSGRYAADVRADEQLARSFGIQSTPTILVNGRIVEGGANYGTLQQAIEAALAVSP